MDTSQYEFVDQFDYTSDNVDITDPCYKKDVWCRINDQHMRPGTYNGWAKMVDTAGWGTRVAALIVLKSDYALEDLSLLSDSGITIGKEIGEIGVDSGLAGVFQDKPDFDDAEWSSFCNLVFDGQYWVTDWGFCTRTGYGDGSYPVNEIVDDAGYIVGYRIDYLV